MNLQPGITVIVHTANSAKTLDACLKSVAGWADELLVVDQQSTDDSVEIAKKYKARIIPFAKVGYVEPARQMALEAVETEWTAILDADEELPAAVRNNLSRLLESPSAEVYALPRKNMIFGQWAKGGWWPDYQVRFFKTGTVRWPAHLHAQPEILGELEQLPAKEDWAILHHNYDSIDSFVQRALKYSTISAVEIDQKKRPAVDHPLRAYLQDFILWYYARDGKSAGTHGLALSSLQSFFEILTLTKYWENHKFPRQELPPVTEILDKAADDAYYWQMYQEWEKATGWKKIYYRIRMKLLL
jgi:glycosyltransferase involved in cell wall biosynthesis